MRLTKAQEIAEKTIEYFAQSNRRSVIRLSDVGVTSVKTLVQAMLLELADQYQLEISNGARTVTDFKQYAMLHDELCGRIVFGGCLPDDVYDRVVKKNPDPKRLFRALIRAGHQRETEPGTLGTETSKSFYNFLTSLDPLSPIYWPAVYDRLGLPFHSDTVPPDRINFRRGKGHWHLTTTWHTRGDLAGGVSK